MLDTCWKCWKNGGISGFGIAVLIGKLKSKFSPSALPLESGDYTIPFFNFFFNLFFYFKGACLPA